jgi:hypothetical protein
MTEEFMRSNPLRFIGVRWYMLSANGIYPSHLSWNVRKPLEGFPWKFSMEIYTYIYNKLS